jgi:hypothetical protein
MACRGEGTWLSPTVVGDVRLFRLLHLATIVAGLNQKPCALLAWDVQWTHKVLHDVRRRGGSAGFLGTTLIVLRMVYAKVGQETVGKLAAALQRAGRSWDKAGVRELLKKLSKLDREDAGRTRGRLVQNSGPHWCRKVLRMRRFCRLERAGEALGCILRGPAVAGDSSVLARAFETLNSVECRLPGFGTYNRASAIRMACSSRLLFDGVRAALDEATWSRHIRAMRKDNVSVFLDAVGVFTLGDARAMSRTVANVLRANTSFRTAAKFGKTTLADLALQACEASCMLDKVACHMAPRSRSRRQPLLPTHSPSRLRDGTPRSRVLAVQLRTQMHRAAAEWVLRRLPVDAASLAKLSKQLRLQQHRRHRESADRMDSQSAAETVATWLATEPKEVRQSLWNLVQPESTQMTTPWLLPCIACPECGRPSENESHRQKRILCLDCAADRRRAWDRGRLRPRRD